MLVSNQFVNRLLDSLDRRRELDWFTDLLCAGYLAAGFGLPLLYLLWPRRTEVK